MKLQTSIGQSTPRCSNRGNLAYLVNRGRRINPCPTTAGTGLFADQGCGGSVAVHTGPLVAVW